MKKKKMGFLSNIQTEIHKFYPSVPYDFTHALCLGETGSGKTTGFIYPNLSDRLSRGHGILFFDFKGKEHLALKSLAKRHGRLKDVIEIGKPWGCNFNLISMFTISELSALIRKLVSGNSSQESGFWAIAAAGLFENIYRLIKLTKELNILCECGGVLPKETVSIELSFENIHKIVSSPIVLSKTLVSYKVAAETLSGIISIEIGKQFGQDFKKAAKNKKIKKLLEYTMEIKNTLEYLTSYMHLNRTDEMSGYYSVVMTLSSVLANFANKDYLNKKEVDIFEELSNGKILVLSIEGLDDIAISAIFNAINSGLAFRGKHKKLNPITIFADEAHRVIGEDWDVGVDVLREAKVEMILATQNLSLLIKSLGDANSVLSIMGNLSTQYSFRLSDRLNASDAVDTSSLETYEYIRIDDESEETKKSTPILLGDDELFDAELEWQKANKKLLPNNQKQIRVYDARLYEKNGMISLYDGAQYSYDLASNHMRSDLSEKEYIDEMNRIKGFTQIDSDGRLSLNVL